MVLLGVVSHVEVVLFLAQDRCTLCAECTSGTEIILSTPDHTPRLVKRKLVLVRLEIVLISAQHRYTYVLNVPWAWKSFWAQPMVLLGIVSHVEARVCPFGGSVGLNAR